MSKYERKDDTLLVGLSFSSEDSGVLIVGRKNGAGIDIVNAFEGYEAKALYEKLITKKEKKDG